MRITPCNFEECQAVFRCLKADETHAWQVLDRSGNDTRKVLLSLQRIRKKTSANILGINNITKRFRNLQKCYVKHFKLVCAYKNNKRWNKVFQISCIIFSHLIAFFFIIYICHIISFQFILYTFSQFPKPKNNGTV